MPDVAGGEPAPGHQDHPTGPSTFYDQAQHSPVYRLSELMFGSLLAAYVLGFITVNPGGKSFVDQLGHLAPYLFISVSFAYLTAAMYLAYHASILTMPTMPLDRLRWDFGLALFEAIAFGFAMRFPMAFPLAIGATFLCASARQWIECRNLAKRLADHHRPVQGGIDRPTEDEAVYMKQFRLMLVKKLKEFETLRGWSPVRPTLLVVAAGIMVISGAAWWAQAHLPEFMIDYDWLVFIQTALPAPLVILRSHGKLKESASFLSDRYRRRRSETNKYEFTKMDEQYIGLLNHLRASQDQKAQKANAGNYS